MEIIGQTKKLNGNFLSRKRGKNEKLVLDGCGKVKEGQDKVN